MEGIIAEEHREKNSGCENNQVRVLRKMVGIFQKKTNCGKYFRKNWETEYCWKNSIMFKKKILELEKLPRKKCGISEKAWENSRLSKPFWNVRKQSRNFKMFRNVVKNQIKSVGSLKKSGNTCLIFLGILENRLENLKLPVKNLKCPKMPEKSEIPKTLRKNSVMPKKSVLEVEKVQGKKSGISDCRNFFF